ncbi:MAG: HlyD family efflux transporter periplasmic adaptor subunit [Bacteroides sp.]|nr:HlyD family efflux transporter periplasmic adaptor subunit [Bacteroides sp.]
MDREIPKDVIRKKRIRVIVKFSSLFAGVAVAIFLLVSYMKASIEERAITLSEVEEGMLEVSVSASGKVVPAFEEIINSPINSRIVEVYCQGGDSVDVGTPILRLDLQSTETEYKKLLNEQEMRTYQLEQWKAKTRTQLSEMGMKIDIAEMKLDWMRVELRNEQYLDSLGAGTTDKVREAQLSYQVAQMELEQQKQQYENEKVVAEAEQKVKEPEFDIFRKSLAEMKRTFEDAQIRSPRKAILTYINNQIGSQVGQGVQLAIISDLSHFKLEGDISDNYADRVRAGSRVIVRLGSDQLEGVISSMTPLSRNGVISFSVQLTENNHPRLRSGLKTDLYIMHAVKDHVLRIRNGPYYIGPSTYELFVVEGGELVKRKVVLGDSNFEHVEVVSGLNPGDRVVVSDMADYRNKTKLKLN